MPDLIELLEYQDLVIGLTVKQWLGLLLAVPAAVLVGTLLEMCLIAVGRFAVTRTTTEWDDEVVRLLPGPARLALGLLTFMALVEVIGLTEKGAAGFLLMFIRAGLIISGVWFAARALAVGSRFLQLHLTHGITSDISRRAIQTQIAVPYTILRFLLIVVGIALVLWQFPVVQSLGAGVLGVAGLAAAAATFSTQRTLSNIFAGLQIAVAQPVKIGDSVVIDGEFGVIEEVTITYVVVRIWDLRRLILPMNYFLEKPIQNWTRGSTKLLGTVFIYADYTVPVAEVRAEFDRLISGSDLWNGEARGLVVTNLTDRSVELRALVSADDGGKLFDLRCSIREALLAWLQQRGQGYLPQNRVNVQNVEAPKS